GERGMDAWALSEENQMELRLQTNLGSAGGSPASFVGSANEIVSGEPPETAGQAACAPQSEFAAFAEVGEAIAATPAKLEKVRLLADYLRSLTAEQLPIAAIYFTGKA